MAQGTRGHGSIRVRPGDGLLCEIHGTGCRRTGFQDLFHRGRQPGSQFTAERYEARHCGNEPRRDHHGAKCRAFEKQMNEIIPTTMCKGRFLALVKEGHWEYAERTNATGAAIIVAV